MAKNKLTKLLKKDVPGGGAIDAANHPRLDGMYLKISLGVFALVLVSSLFLYDNGYPERNQALLRCAGFTGACCLGIYLRMKYLPKYLRKRYERDAEKK